MQQMNEQTMKMKRLLKNELKTTNIDFVVTCNSLLLSTPTFCLVCTHTFHVFACPKSHTCFANVPALYVAMST